jgi:hypothetical protein
MAGPEVKSTEQKQKQIIKETMGVGGLSLVFFLLWGWLTSIDAIAWLHPFLLAIAVVCGIMGVVHWVMMEMLRHGFKQ